MRLPVLAVDWGAVGTLVLASLAIMGTPGPATISVTAAAVAFGVRRSAGYTLGIVAGTAGVLLAVATGVTAALLAVPRLRAVLVTLAAAYIVWLAYRVATAPPLADAAADAPAFGGGALLGLANPKAWVAIAAVFASTRLAGHAAADAAAKVAILTLIIFVIQFGWLIAGASFAPLFRHPRRARVLNVALAALMVAATALAVLH